MRSPLCALSAALSLVVVAGCHEVPAPEVSRAPSPAAPPPSAAAEHAPEAVATEEPASSGAPVASAPRVALTPLTPNARVVLEQIQGGTPDLAGRVFASVQDRMEQCGPAGTGGAVKVRVASTKDATSLVLDPSSTVEGAMRRCVLEALSTMDVDSVFDRGGPAPRPSSFSSLVTIAW